MNDYDIVNASWGLYLEKEDLKSSGISDATSITQLHNELTAIGLTPKYRGDALQVIAAANDSKSCATITQCNVVAINAALRNENFVDVGALNDEGTKLDSYSNQAGLLMNNFISAPVWETSEGARGTSYAAPIVSGTAALIMDKFNNTNANNTLDIIFSTADDLGVKGVDAVYGHGRLNIGRALSPVGMLK